MRRRVCTVFVLIALLMSCFAGALAVTPEDWDGNAPEKLEAGHLYSQAAILIDADTGEVLLEKNASERMYPASTTKIMTLMLALESGIALDERVTIPEEAGKVPSDSSFVPVLPGEEMSFRDLLYGVMINSGNDGANAIAVLVSGSVEAFVEKMNQRAAELGCTDTHFVNPHGYHDDNHYTTARDLAQIATVAMQNEDFRKIVSAQSYTMAATSKRKALELVTRNMLLKPDSEYYYADALGIKTGFHSKAGQCLVSAAEREGKLLIAVVLNSDGKVASQKWLDASRLFEYGYRQYTSYTLTDLYNRASYDLTSVVVPNAAQDDPQAGTLDLQLVKLSDEGYSQFVRNVEGALPEAVSDFAHRVRIDLKSSLSAPIDAGEIIGSFAYTTKESQEITGVLIASRGVEARVNEITAQDIFPFLRLFNDPVVKWSSIAALVLIVALIVWLARRSAIRERRRREIYQRRRKEYERRVRNGEFNVSKRRKKGGRRARSAKRRDQFFD